MSPNHIPKEPVYNVIPRTDRSAACYELAFGPAIGRAQSIADVGAGDSDFANVQRAQGVDTMRIDMQYANDPPEGEAPWVSADITEGLPIADEQYAVTVSAWMFQHLHQPGSISKAIQEMIRITKTDAVPSDRPNGQIHIYPVYNDAVVTRALEALPGGLYGSVVGLSGASNEAELSRRDEPMHTLLLYKSPQLTKEVAVQIADAVEASGALLAPRPTPPRIVRQMLQSGSTRVPSTIRKKGWF